MLTLFITVSFKLNLQSMSNQEIINSLSDFLVCQAQDCHQAISICHKTSFKDFHHDVINDKKVMHKSVPLQNSIQFLNFRSIYRLNYILARKLAQIVNCLKSNVNTVIQSVLYNSAIFREMFNHSDQSISEYFYLSQIHQGSTMGKIEYFSSDFCNTLLMFNEKPVNKLYREVCGYSPEWQNLNIEFNYASGINSSYLEQFINKEIQYLVSYINKAEEKFDIKQYIALRNSSKQYQNDPYYFSHQFTSFLIQKYEKNAAEQTIFGLMEYYLNFWYYFFILIDTNKNSVKFFEEEISFYREYEKYSEELKLNQSFLAYRMWRINRKTSTYLPSLRNPYFLETFIYSFIQYLIQKKLFAPQQERNYDFKNYAIFIQDYVKYVNDKGEEFNFNRYNEYYQFRKIIQKLQQNLKKNKEIVYDKKFFLEYANHEFSQSNKLSIKKYKKYQEKRANEEVQKATKFREQSENLKTELLSSEKQHFYQVVFNNFMNEVAQPKSSYKLNKQSYELFKQTLFAKFDESYIQSIEAEYRLSLEQQKEELKQQKSTQTKEKVKEEINTAQQKLAEFITEEVKSEADSSQEENDLVENCPCCKGKPYECEEPDCKILGCCTACMLDY